MRFNEDSVSEDNKACFLEISRNLMERLLLSCDNDKLLVTPRKQMKLNLSLKN